MNVNLLDLLKSSVLEKFAEGVHNAVTQVGAAEKSLGDVFKAAGYRHGEKLVGQAAAVTAQAGGALDQGVQAATGAAEVGASVLQAVAPAVLAGMVLPISGDLLAKSEGILAKVGTVTVAGEIQTIVKHNHGLLSIIDAALHDLSNVVDAVDASPLVASIGGYALLLPKINDVLKAVETKLDEAVAPPSPSEPAPEAQPAETPAPGTPLPAA